LNYHKPNSIIIDLLLKQEQIIYLGLGSNLGDRLGQLESAVAMIAKLAQTRLIAKSSWLENPAVGEAVPHDFLNGVIKISSKLEPLELLNALREIEMLIDPERSSRGRKLARKIDIDILLYGDLVLETKELVIPHPRMHEREFVMKPLLEIEPSLRSASGEVVILSEAKDPTTATQ